MPVRLNRSRPRCAAERNHPSGSLEFSRHQTSQRTNHGGLCRGQHLSMHRFIQVGELVRGSLPGCDGTETATRLRTPVATRWTQLVAEDEVKRRESFVNGQDLSGGRRERLAPVGLGSRGRASLLLNVIMSRLILRTRNDWDSGGVAWPDPCTEKLAQRTGKLSSASEGLVRSGGGRRGRAVGAGG
jgi:hypothetical protein